MPCQMRPASIADGNEMQLHILITNMGTSIAMCLEAEREQALGQTELDG